MLKDIFVIPVPLPSLLWEREERMTEILLSRLLTFTATSTKLRDISFSVLVSLLGLL